MSWKVFAGHAAATTACWCRLRAAPVWAAAVWAAGHCFRGQTSSRMLALGTGSAASIATPSCCSAQALRSSPSAFGDSVDSGAQIYPRAALKTGHQGWPQLPREIARRGSLVLSSRLPVGKKES